MISILDEIDSGPNRHSSSLQCPPIPERVTRTNPVLAMCPLVVTRMGLGESPGTGRVSYVNLQVDRRGVFFFRNGEMPGCSRTLPAAI